MLDSSKMVDRQLRLVGLKHELERLGRLPPRARPDDVHYGPCLLFSRECGSIGDEVATLAGERLHWHVFQREIVEEIAQRAHVRQQLVDSVDERVRSRWQRLLHPVRERQGLRPETYLYYLHEVVLALAHHGDVVLVGRGAHFLIPKECALRVRIIEPVEIRAERIRKERDFSSAQAFDFVQQREIERAMFIRTAFHEDADSPLNYDLVINAAQLTAAAVVEIVLSGVQQKFGVKSAPASCAR